MSGLLKSNQHNKMCSGLAAGSKYDLGSRGPEQVLGREEKSLISETDCLSQQDCRTIW